MGIVFLCVDETSKGADEKRTLYAGAVIGSLDEDMKIHSFFMEKLEKNPDGDSIVGFVEKTIKLLYPEDPEKGRQLFNVFITDGAHYMKNAGKNWAKNSPISPV